MKIADVVLRAKFTYAYGVLCTQLVPFSPQLLAKH